MKFLTYFPEREFEAIMQILQMSIQSSKDQAVFSEEVLSKRLDRIENDEISSEEIAMEEDYQKFLKEIQQLSYQTALISLQMITEITLKKVLSENLNTSAQKFNIKDILNAYKNNGVDLHNEENFADFNEVWKIANCLKHQGINPSNSILSLPKKRKTKIMKEGKLHVSEESFSEYYINIKNFIQDIIKKVN